MKKIIMLLMVCVLILGGCGKKKNTVHSLDDLKNKSIGVQMKTTGDIYVSDIEGAQIKRFNKGLDAVKALRKGVVDAVMIDDAPAKVLQSGLMMWKFYPNHMRRKNTALLSIRTSGSF